MEIALVKDLPAQNIFIIYDEGLLMKNLIFLDMVALTTVPLYGMFKIN